MNRLDEQQGQTVIEMLVALVLVAILMVGVINIIVSGSRAGGDANARIDAQQNTRLAVDRLEYEGRCASAATLVSSGSGVAFTLPTQCSHATGTVSWCVTGGALVRYTTAACTGRGQTYITGVTSTTPFSLPTTPSGDLPQLAIAITVNTIGAASTSATLDDQITLRNAAAAS
jgi:prepilin-type N-terminal cleavage/methylation domain-containing protein